MKIFREGAAALDFFAIRLDYKLLPVVDLMSRAPRRRSRSQTPETMNLRRIGLRRSEVNSHNCGGMAETAGRFLLAFTTLAGGDGVVSQKRQVTSQRCYKFPRLNGPEG